MDTFFSLDDNIFFDPTFLKSECFETSNDQKSDSYSKSDTTSRTSADDMLPLLNRLTITDKVDSSQTGSHRRVEKATQQMLRNVQEIIDTLSDEYFPIKNGEVCWSEENSSLIIEKEGKNSEKKFIINKKDELNSGAGKRVFLGYTESGGLVVYSELKLEKRTNERSQKNFNNEAKNLKIFKDVHEGVIVQYISAIKNHFNDNVIGLVQEYCPMGDLFDFIYDKKFAKLEAPAKFGIFLNCVNALRILKQHNIHHRDIKPENFFLTYQNGELTAKLGDFEYSTTLEEEMSNPRCMGTVRYFAPECYRTYTIYREQIQKKEPIDPTIIAANIANLATDMFALGVVLYEMRKEDIPGYLDFEEEGDLVTSIYHLTDDDINESFSDKIIPNSLEDINRSMLSLDPTKRPTPEALALKVQSIKNNHSWE